MVADNLELEPNRTISAVNIALEKLRKKPLFENEDFRIVENSIWKLEFEVADCSLIPLNFRVASEVELSVGPMSEMYFGVGDFDQLVVDFQRILTSRASILWTKHRLLVELVDELDNVWASIKSWSIKGYELSGGYSEGVRRDFLPLYASI